MKKIIFYTLGLLIMSMSSLLSQDLPFTGGVPCTNCVPTGWNIISGTPDHSNPTGKGGNSQFPWSHIVTPPPSNYVLASFLSLNNSISKKDVASTKITGLVSGAKYEIKYHVMSSASQATQGKYGKSATIKLGIGGQFPVQIASQTTTFTEELNTGMWISKTLTFTAVSDFADLEFSGTASDVGGFVFLDIAKNALTSACKSGTQQVPLSATTLMIDCPSKEVYLTTATATTPAPTGASVVWYSNPTHSGNPVNAALGVTPGIYYAFYNDAVDQSCFNTNQSTSKITVISQLQLKANITTITCSHETIDLNSFLKDFKLAFNESVEWYSNPSHSGQPINDPAHASIGKYYAFVRDPTANCFNTDLSTAVVEVVNLVPALEKTALSNTCPTSTANLGDAISINSAIPPGFALKWHTTPNRTDSSPISDPTKASAGTYYAFYVASASGCYTSEVSAAKVTVTINACQAEVPDLTTGIDIDGLNFNDGAGRDFVVNLFEVAHAETSGTISFRVTKLGAFNITYPTVSGNSNVFGSTPNQNSNWSFTENASFITATLRPGLIIDADDQATIGFNVSRKGGIPSKTTQNLTVTIVGGSGGETNSTNNKSVNNLSTN
jgi:hypothetical protein